MTGRLGDGIGRFGDIFGTFGRHIIDSWVTKHVFKSPNDSERGTAVHDVLTADSNNVHGELKPSQTRVSCAVQRTKRIKPIDLNITPLFIIIIIIITGQGSLQHKPTSCLHKNIKRNKKLNVAIMFEEQESLQVVF